MKMTKTILLVMAGIMALVAFAGIVWSIKTAPTKTVESTMGQVSPASTPEPEKLLVKAGVKTYLRVPFGSQSVTWDLKEWGPSVIVKYEEGTMRVRVPDGKGGMKWDDHFTYTKGMSPPEFDGKTETISFFSSDQDVTILWRVN